MDFINTDFLRALDALPSSLTASLESSAPPSQPAPSITATLASSTIIPKGPLEGPVKKEKKVRMGRVPAGVVPGVTPPPDPERWLKKSERSTVTQSKRRKGGGGGGATQGSVEGNSVGVATTPKSVSGSHGKGKKKR